MALKDWKKEKSPVIGNLLFSDIKDKKNIPHIISGIWSMGRRISISKNRDKTWSVKTAMKQHKPFKTKASALSFAKDYMRRH